ncbi:F-box domain-containing protein [Fusarium keratoplasticum]|uniref:F-box domain-containing protein n=1 Tax=Fusarium keratoplasticum TaxID=1328300 RepID=A0ACC0RBV5_9HYPO|nr:F-box domain-containing protein [Fusarium keratoplasticum]KAI8683586.1 F-box domain-containing protein [Fusarium keratoplasticum]
MDNYRGFELSTMPSFRTIHRIRQHLFGDAVLIDDEAALGSDSTKPEKRAVGHTATEDQSHRWTVANTNNGLVKLPTELHMMIMEHLTFGQVESLRRTCRALRGRISKPVIREVFPGIKFELLSTCYRCLCYDPLRDTLIRADESDARYPLANECLDCVAARGGFMVGRRYTLGTWASVWVCRYCGYPVTSGAAWNEPEFHRVCYRRFHWMLFYFFLVGIAQGLVTIIGSALCWGFYNKEKMVLAPTIVNFFMASWVFCLTLLRNVELRTYHWTLILELGILGLWIPPLLTILGSAQNRPGRPSPADVATIFFVVSNIMFRVVNVLGNAILMSEYKLWRRHRPNQSLAQRALSKTAAILVFWTYPQSVEQKYPGKWWLTRRELQQV